MLLGLLAGHRRIEPHFVTERDWRSIEEIAADHRLGPALHARWGGSEDVPAPLRTQWASAYRTSAMTALGQRRALLELAASLAGKGIPSLALKGSWLAWTLYDAPAERPMRDLDVLVPPGMAQEAWDTALALGYSPAEPALLPLAEWARRYKHLPALANADGVLLEIHLRLWEEDRHHPPQMESLFERAIADETHRMLRYLSPADQFAHLAVHAVNAHHWDAGPLALLDLIRFAERAAPDWSAVWPRAQAEGWARPAALAVAVIDRWMQPGMLEESACPIRAPEQLVGAAPALIAKPSSVRESDRAALKAARGSLGNKLRRIAARRAHFGRTADYLKWLASQAGEVAGSRADPSAKARLASARALDAWLTG